MNVDALPRITISPDDLDRLHAIADGARQSAPDVAEYLLQELDRATIRAPQNGGARDVAMGSFVEFRDDKTGQVRTVQLVYPSDADATAGRISVLTPIGAALIGLSEGQSIEWQTRGGEHKTLTVLKVSGAPDDYGYLDV